MNGEEDPKKLPGGDIPAEGGAGDVADVPGVPPAEAPGGAGPAEGDAGAGGAWPQQPKKDE